MCVRVYDWCGGTPPIYCGIELWNAKRDKIPNTLYCLLYCFFIGPYRKTKLQKYLAIIASNDIRKPLLIATCRTFKDKILWPQIFTPPPNN